MEERIQRDVNERKRQNARKAHSRRENRLRPRRRTIVTRLSTAQASLSEHQLGARFSGLFICLVVAGGFYEYHKVHSVAKGVFGAGDGKISKSYKKVNLFPFWPWEQMSGR